MEGLATRLDGITKERGNSRPAHENSHRAVAGREEESEAGGEEWVLRTE